jgi:hypothetical protein
MVEGVSRRGRRRVLLEGRAEAVDGGARRALGSRAAGSECSSENTIKSTYHFIILRIRVNCLYLWFIVLSMPNRVGTSDARPHQLLPRHRRNAPRHTISHCKRKSSGRTFTLAFASRRARADFSAAFRETTARSAPPCGFTPCGAAAAVTPRPASQWIRDGKEGGGDVGAPDR